MVYEYLLEFIRKVGVARFKRPLCVRVNHGCFFERLICRRFVFYFDSEISERFFHIIADAFASAAKHCKKRKRQTEAFIIVRFSVRKQDFFIFGSAVLRNILLTDQPHAHIDDSFGKRKLSVLKNLYNALTDFNISFVRQTLFRGHAFTGFGKNHRLFEFQRLLHVEQKLDHSFAAGAHRRLCAVRLAEGSRVNAADLGQHSLAAFCLQCAKTFFR